MGINASRLNLRLFIDGIELPVIGARTIFPEQGPATAEIQMVATNEVWDLPPRSLVTLFVYDAKSYSGDNKGGVLRYYPVGPQDPRHWKLLFMGEIAGVTFQKRDDKRAAILSCIDFTSYWDFLKQHYVNFQNGGVELFENAFLGVRMDRIKNFDVVTKDVHSNLLTTLLKSLVDIGTNGKKDLRPSLYLGVQRLLRDQFFSSNFFYARAYNRLRIGDTLVGLSKDTTSAKLFSMQYFQKFISNQISGGGGLVTARQMMDFLLGTVFHTYCTIPCPMFDLTGSMRGLTKDEETDALSGETIDRKAFAGATLNYTVIKPDAWFLVPPACNILFPHQYNEISYQRNFLAEPTRLFMRTSLFFTGKDKWLTERFYAPDFQIFDIFLKLNTGGYLSRMSQVLLPHEDQVGINAIMEWEPDIGAYVAKGARRDYLARLADYDFWKARFGQRALNVSGPLNLEPIPGYPMVVMDRVGIGTEANRHFIGHVANVVHSVDQTGGWTYITLSAARVHDESIDFDAKGRSLEEITSRGTDGFLDDRYDVERIGKEVYMPLFGCGSLLDVFSVDNLEGNLIDLQVAVNVQAIANEKGPVVGAIAAAEALYRSVTSSGSDQEAFVSNVCRRPKADVTQILGLSFLNLDTGEEDAIGHLLKDPTFVSAGDPDILQGFMGVAVNPDCYDMTLDVYTVKLKETTVIGTRPVPPLVESTKDANGVETTKVTPQPDADITKTTYKEGQKASYGLKQHLETRRTSVQAYADSLTTRGIRG